MREQISSENMSNSISSLIHSISKVSDSLLTMLSTGFDQVADFGSRVMSSLKDGASFLFTDKILQSLRRLKLHLADLIKTLEKNVYEFDKESLLNMLYEKEASLIQHMRENPHFERSYGRFVKQDIVPNIKKAINAVSL